MTEESTLDYAAEFSPRQYLQQYYSTESLTDDERAIFQFIPHCLGSNLYDSVLEFGCGPTVHHAFGLAPYAKDLHLCEYLPGNIDEVRQWLRDDPAAHDWDPLFRGILAIDGIGDLATRQEQLRRVVTKVFGCDLRSDPPFESPQPYDLVASFFTVECLGGTKPEWEIYMARVLALVKPGGRVLFGTLRNSAKYSVLGRWFTTTPVNEADFARVLAANGFDLATADIRGVPIEAWKDEGFDSICLIYARKN